ncbi:uncharacterized protein LOC129724329 [Wyeomyia smithii]|uniref:uncharacterized protein LOC129724329 n=1 Tax=Wyeomyia smithii TaxID=174621 RepID=UPI0024680DA7|nr:uncharacterized protein LOC129724329 [Wyeomyia smithii]
MSTTENQPNATNNPDASQASEPKKETVTGVQEAKPSAEATNDKADSTAESAPTAMETEPAAATNGGESEPANAEAKPSTDESKKTEGANGQTSEKKERPRFTTVARKRFRLLIGQGYSRSEAARLAQEPLKPGVAPKGQKKAKFDFDEERKKLTGAGKKRLGWLLRNGFSEQEAIAQARKPMDALRRGRANALGGNSAFSLPTEKRAGSGVIAMAVVKSDHPLNVLTKEQSNKIKSGILKQVTQQKDSQLKPRFEDCVFVNGYLRVICSDRPTVKFLQQNVPKLELWKDASVKVVNEKNILKIETYIGYFADSRQNSNEEILNFVECQNDGLSTSNWKILGRKETSGKMIELKITMDPASTKIVRELGYELNYKFNKIKVVKLQQPNAPAQNSNASMQRAPVQKAQMQRGPMQRASGAPRNQNPPRRNFVPVWDNNMSKQTVFNRAPSPPRRSNFDNFDSNQFNSGSRGNNWGGNSNSFNNGSGGGGGGQSNSRPLSLVDNLFAQLNRTLSANDNRGNNRSNNSFDRQGSRRANNFSSGPYGGRTGGRSFNSRSGFF